jgi:hypothetical protein
MKPKHREWAMTNLQKGQVLDLELPQETAQSYGLKLDPEKTGWWQPKSIPGPPKIHDLDACTVSGKTAERAFYPEELEKCRNYDKMKERCGKKFSISSGRFAIKRGDSSVNRLGV